MRALIRDAAKCEAVKKSFSQVQVVKGGLDDIDLIAQEARDADVILRELTRRARSLSYQMFVTDFISP